MLYTKELADELKAKIESDLASVVKEVDEDEDWMFDVVATTESRDRDGEIIEVNWWDTKAWEKNPVVLANHKYTIENIIGKGTSFYTEGKRKRLKWVFSQKNPLARLAKDLYNEGMLKSVSVWFIPKERSDEDRRVIEKAELLEVSFVAVGSNRDALSLDEKLYKKAVDKGLITENADWTVSFKLKETDDNIMEKILAELVSLKKDVRTLVDDKTEEKESEKKARKVAEQKEILQEVNKATSKALENIKKLK